MENRERICRFCFEKCDKNFKTVEGSTHEILKILLVTMNLTISDEPVMCTSCSEILQKCFAFKKTCLDIRDHSVAFGNDKNNGQAVCEFCMNLFKNCSFTILNIEEDISEKTMLDKYFPELDLSASKKPVICEVCHGALMNFFSFVNISSIVEEKIKKYCEAEGANKTDPIKLNNVLKFIPENVWKENDSKPDIFRMEDTMYVKSENEKMNIQGGICTLCLEKCDDFKALDGNTEKMLGLFLPKIDLTIIQEPAMCKNCEEMLIKCFDFKTMCLHTHDYIVEFLNNKSNIKLDLKDIYLSNNETGSGVPEDQDICGFCMSLVKNWSAVSIDVEKGDVMLEKMIEHCLPELDLSVIKTPVICASCHGSLMDCFHFVMNCSIVGEKITRFCETADVDVNSQIMLSVKDITTKVDGNSVDIIKVEEPFCENRSSHEREIGYGGVKLEQIFLGDVIKGVENENECFVEVNDQKVYNVHQYTLKNMLTPAEESNKPGTVKIEGIFYEENEIKCKEEIEDQQFLLNEEIEIKTDEQDFNRFEDSIVLSQSEVSRRLHGGKKYSVLNLEWDQSDSYIRHTLPEKQVSKIRMYQHQLGSFQTRHKESLMNHNLTLEGFKKRFLVHKHPSEVPMYKCDSCSFQTKYKTNLKKHLILHKNPSEITMYKCDFCLYQTKFNNNLKKHLILHNNPSEVTMYKCDSCLYQTKYKNNLKKHLIVHNNPSEITMYKCDSCLYQTKYKGDLKKHLILHKNPSEVTMYKCSCCSFQTNRKYCLKIHLLTHKNSSEVKMHKCDSCSFETKRKCDLKDHLLTHKDASEETMYKCDSCLYQAKSKHNLKRHLTLHKNPPLEVTMYKCDSCSFQTNCKNNLKRHLILHKDPPPEVTMYRCDSCSFQTNHESYLKDHLLTHKTPSELSVYQTKSKCCLEDLFQKHKVSSGRAVFKCNSCIYQTRHKGDIKKHLIVHKNRSEVPMYKCDHCLFQTKHKGYLKKHLLTHKNPSEITMYKCNSCLYQTKHKSDLKKHLILHRSSPSEVTMYKCESCIYQTMYKENLKQHVILHKNPSEVAMYKCDHCSFQTKYNYCLKRHRLTHKNSQE